MAELILALDPKKLGAWYTDQTGIKGFVFNSEDLYSAEGMVETILREFLVVTFGGKLDTRPDLGGVELSVEHSSLLDVRLGHGKYFEVHFSGDGQQFKNAM